jgi:hypothetical protein
MSRFRGPIWRVAGSFVSWFLFALSFSLLYQGSALVMGLGGFCASGGPYVIETECPDAVVAFVPLSIFGGLIAVAIGAVFAQGFGTPLLTWAWPVLFGGLGAAFLLASTQPGGITFLIIGILFVVMGLVPLVIEIRASLQAVFLGTTNAFDVKFEENGNGRRGLMRLRSFGVEESDERVTPAVGDWALALGVLVVAGGLGVYLAGLMFAAASSPVPQ